MSIKVEPSGWIQETAENLVARISAAYDKDSDGVELRRGKNDSPVISVFFQVLEGKLKDRKIRQFYWLSGNVSSLIELLSSADLYNPNDDGGFEFKIEDLKDKVVQIDIVQNNDFYNVANVQPAGLGDGDDF